MLLQTALVGPHSRVQTVLMHLVLRPPLVRESGAVARIAIRDRSVPPQDDTVLITTSGGSVTSNAHSRR